MQAHEERHSTIAYYREPAIDGSRPGQYYINTSDPETRPRYEAEALAFHEAVPGHHLQIALAQEMENVPPFRKWASYTAFIEGWGLYSESLGGELGLYRDPHARFGKLTYEMWRAIRLVVDTGIHAKGWTRDRAIDFFRTHAGKADHDISVEVDRYIVWPGQALAYKIGQLKITELRKRAQERLGSAFDIRAFHDVVLAAGPIPLSLLERRVEGWMTAVEK
jgi:prolyl oligopeptidase